MAGPVFRSNKGKRITDSIRNVLGRGRLLREE